MMPAMREPAMDDSLQAGMGRLLQRLQKAGKPGGGGDIEQARWLACIEHLEMLLQHPEELRLLEACLQAGCGSRKKQGSVMLVDWFHYYAELLRCHDLLVHSPLFRRFKVNRYEMLSRFEGWTARYQELTRLSGVMLDETLMAWPAFIEHFRVRKLFKYLTAFWVQWQGMSATEARRLVSLFGIRTKASQAELEQMHLPWPPGFDSILTPVVADAGLVVAEDGSTGVGGQQVLVLFQPVYANGSRQVHHCEALIRVHTRTGMKQPAELLFVAERRARWLLFGLEVLTGRLPYLDYPLALSLYPEDLLDTGVLDGVLALLAVPDHKQLILELDSALVVAQGERLLPVLHQLYEQGCRFLLDNCGTGVLPEASLLEFFSLFKPHAGLLHDSMNDIHARLMLQEIYDYAKNRGILIIAQQVDSAAMLQFQQRLGFDLAQGSCLGPPGLHPPRRDEPLLPGTASVASGQ